MGGGGRLQNSNEGEILSSTKSRNGSFLSTSKKNTEKRGRGEGGDYRILMRARYDPVQSQVK